MLLRRPSSSIANSRRAKALLDCVGIRGKLGQLSRSFWAVAAFPWVAISLPVLVVGVGTSSLFALDQKEANANPVVDDRRLTPEELIAEQVPEARRRIEAFHGEALGKSNRTLQIVYWTPADREPAPEYRERLTRVLRHVQGFYAKEMERLGFGRSTFKLEDDGDGLVKIHLVKGAANYSDYNVQSGARIRRESLPVLSKAGVNADQETVVIFCNMSNWDPESGKISQNSPYYAGGGLNGGTAWQVDSPILDSDKLADKMPVVSDGQYGRISIGKYNSIFVGGVCHELGHAFGLPHNKERPDEQALFGTALMGSGNRSYGDELRSEGKGSFLTLGEGLRLATHPLFLSSDEGIAVPRSSTIDEIEISKSGDGKSFVVSGRVVASPECYAVVAYMDPVGGSDYDATTITAVPDKDGRFKLDCYALKANSASELRLVACTVGGGSIGDQTLVIPYSVSKEGDVDLSLHETRHKLQSVVDAVDGRNLSQAKSEVGRLRRANAEAQILEVAEAILAGAQTPTRTPAEAKGKMGNLSELKPSQAKLGYGRPVFNRLPEGGGLIMSGGEMFARGIYAHAPSLHVYDLGEKWKKFRGRVGVADGRGGSCVFVIKADEKILWQSDVLKEGKTVAFEVNVENVKSLQLIVEDGGDGKASDWGLWLNPELSR